MTFSNGMTIEKMSHLKGNIIVKSRKIIVKESIEVIEHPHIMSTKKSNFKKHIPNQPTYPSNNRHWVIDFSSAISNC